MRLADFIVIGAAKSGTTSLCDYLNHHPQIFMSDPKEPNFFSFDRHYEKGLESYSQLFEQAKSDQLCGEGSVTYSMNTKYPDTPKRIAQQLPHVKLIYIVRHPLDRLVSNWKMLHRSKVDCLDFADILLSNERAPAFIDRSKYWSQINSYRTHFSDDQILVLFFEDLINDPIATTARCYAFLGLDTQVAHVLNTTNVKNSADSQVNRTKLSAFLKNNSFTNAAIKLVPRYIKQQLLQSSLFNRQHNIRTPQWTEESFSYAVEQIKPDAERFLTHYGKAADFWSFSKPIID